MENVEKVKRDNRAISDEFFERFKPEGDLHPFVKLVKEYEDELELCFRGNDGSVSIYRNGHQAFKITKTGNIAVSFSIARYCEDWENLLDKLAEFSFKVDIDNIKEKIRQGDTIYIGRAGKPLSFEALKKLYDDIIIPMFTQYFSVQEKAEAIDYFKLAARKENTGRNPAKKLEKKRQQEIYSRLKNTKSGYFLHDMEFQQPHSNRMEMKKDKNNNKPDMLGGYFNDFGVPERLVLVEVKCTKTSVNDKKSGLAKHISCIENYAGCEEHIRARRREAFEIIKQYAELELRGLSKEFAASYDEDFYKTHFENMPVESLIILTDEAVGCFDNTNRMYKLLEDKILDATEYEYEIYSKEL